MPDDPQQTDDTRTSHLPDEPPRPAGALACAVIGVAAVSVVGVHAMWLTDRSAHIPNPVGMPIPALANLAVLVGVMACVVWLGQSLSRARRAKRSA